MKGDYLIVDENTKLHKPIPAFAEAIFKIADTNRKRLGEWLTWVDNTTDVSHVEDFIKNAHRFNMGGQQLTTFILYQEKLVGTASFPRIDRENDFGEIGYWISQEYEGKGIITKSVERLVRYGFEKMGLNRIEIHVAAGNTKSQAVPRRLGFKEEGVLRDRLRIREDYHDIIIFSLLKSDFS